MARKTYMLIILLFVICLGAFSFFWSRIETKVEAIQIVKEHYLPKERLESFVSRVSKEGKFKLIGWDIKPTEEKHTFVVSYTLNRLDKEGFKTGPVEGYWFEVNTQKGTCKQIFPEGTLTPSE
ncbi:hypothetical protein Tlie_1585 [Thermovirga lienii DSM 17291]|uniref:DUF3139 domain-containing protein n=1 Tax=Thermovirga lienii (strain ATCC BAA-1197 / DSM 17291 / Cas60314) TaxID=580340 RepID=G7V7Q3_THELD|nr:hypothetical protein [Thermovirga lienii]AER67307.1 hypothetical protein Tlie_1585 [Thermovirga lienii DSM 17291]MDN5319098.1 hypothetical protein [Thermovirga sp.]MDN5367803.1 hypothetical protein [Thermovirga sp.]HCD71596.1 hypothetical protein [Thermovirga lienii]